MKLSYKQQDGYIHPHSEDWGNVDLGELDELYLDNILDFEKEPYESAQLYGSFIKHGGKFIIEGLHLLGVARDLAMSKSLDVSGAAKLIYEEFYYQKNHKLIDTMWFARKNAACPFTLIKILESRGFTTLIKRIEGYSYYLEFQRA